MSATSCCCSDLDCTRLIRNLNSTFKCLFVGRQATQRPVVEKAEPLRELLKMLIEKKFKLNCSAAHVFDVSIEFCDLIEKDVYAKLKNRPRK